MALETENPKLSGDSTTANNPIVSAGNNSPSATWTDDQIVAYAQEKLKHATAGQKEVDELDARIAIAGRATTVSYWDAGEALDIVHSRAKHGTWGTFLDRVGISRKTANVAMHIYHAYKLRSDAAKVSLVDAKRLWSYQERDKRDKTGSVGQQTAKANEVLPVSDNEDRQTVVETLNTVVDMLNSTEGRYLAALSTTANIKRLKAIGVQVAELITKCEAERDRIAEGVKSSHRPVYEEQLAGRELVNA